MKDKVYLRVAKTKRGKLRYTASTRPSNAPISEQYGDTFLPTISFALELDIPDELFKKAEQTIAKINLEAKDVNINAEIIAN